MAGSGRGDVEGFYEDAQGRTRPITGKKKGGALITAAVVAGAVAASGGALGGAGTASVGGAVDSVAGQAVHARINSGQKAARKGKRSEAWRSMRLKTARKSVQRHLECAVHSYGQVQQFFARTPCRSLQRELLMIADEHGNTGVLSIAWVRMRSVGSAARLKRLVDVYGTGNVSPIADGVLERQDIRFTGKYYGSRRVRSLVVIAEAAPAAGEPDPAVLDGAAEVAAWFPPP